MKKKHVQNIPKNVTHGVTEKLLQRAMRLLAIPSVHDRPTERNQALDFVIQELQASPGITIEHFEKNGVRSILAYHGYKRPARFKILLNGHVDVVPANMSQFSPKVVDQRLYARGALDMKVAVLVLVDIFIEMVARLPYDLGLQITTDEEPGGYDGAKYQLDQGVRTDFYLTGEQSWNDVAVAAKGLCRIKVTRQGIAAHSAYLWRGENALLKLIHLVEKVLKIYPEPTEEAWATTVNVAHLQTTGEYFFNRVPAAGELHLDIRPVVEDRHFTSKEAVKSFITALDAGAQITHLTLEKGHHIDTKDPFLKALLSATEEAKAAPVKLLKRHGQSDLRHYIADPLTKGVEFGLKGKHDHGDGEYLDLTSVPIMQKALQKFLTTIS